ALAGRREWSLGSPAAPANRPWLERCAPGLRSGWRSPGWPRDVRPRPSAPSRWQPYQRAPAQSRPAVDSEPAQEAVASQVVRNRTPQLWIPGRVVLGAPGLPEDDLRAVVQISIVDVRDAEPAQQRGQGRLG